MLYTDDSWTYNRQMYKTYGRECLRDKRLRVIDTFQFDLFTSCLQGTTLSKHGPFFSLPSSPSSPFFPYYLCARYVHFSSFRFWFRFGLTFFSFSFCFLQTKIVKLYKKLVSIVFIDGASYSPHSPTQLQKGRQADSPDSCPHQLALHLPGAPFYWQCVCLVASGIKTSSIL